MQVFAVAVILVGLGVLVGGQVWVYTSSEIWGWLAGLVAAGVSGTGWCAFTRRAAAATDVRFLGESQQGLDESEYSEIEETDVLDGKRVKIEQDIERSPQHVADSIRSMLEGSGSIGRTKRGSRRG